METNTRVKVDEDHCRRAAEELYEILRTQHRAFVARVYSSGSLRAAIKVARVFGLIVALLGLLLVGMLRSFDTRSWSTQPPLWFIPILLLSIPVFLFQPWLEARIQGRVLRRADRRARLSAQRALRAALALVPYESNYDLKGDLSICTRIKDGEFRLAWFRSLGQFRARGLAVQAESVTAIFRKPSSLTLAVIILQHDRDWTDRVLREVGVEIRRTPGTSL